MSELRDLYQEVILDHWKRPRNFGKSPLCNRQADGHNPLCGDKLTIYLLVKDGTVEEVTFDGAGCAISVASASLMTEMLKGLSVADARALFERFQGAMTGSGDGVDSLEDLDKLAVLSGVREFPVRVKCATLAWHTFRAALDDSDDTVVTE
ncbi:MAG: SUF system NifU family Fe-S cluster assembly protein [Proteobacteria bacterium]|nr:SUF system NifU family Fe-S cluster assembly protein [Pseudomonadota bacterium]